MLLVVSLGLLLRVLVGQFGYSGQGKPPLYGDYEAQRHWMEITYNLPVSDWYRNTTDNDLLYWGLDYPPLTAYHSWANGAFAHHLNSTYVTLKESRGNESPDLKAFMRFTVLAADLVTFILPAVLHLRRSHPLAIFALLTYPALILIDHGHFQYNCVSLGLVLACLAALSSGHDSLSATLFTLALNYKQMALYYALPIFAYFLDKCRAQYSTKGFPGVLTKFLSLAVTVLLVFALVWSPFLTDLDSLATVAGRLFPIGRGIFEDKVANFWCVLNVVVKVKSHLTNEMAALLCAVVTLLAVLPSFLHLLFVRSSPTSLLYALLNSSLAFFLFSFHVHEKTILFVALPALLLVERELMHTRWLLSVSTFSLLPLIVKDNLLLPFLATSALFHLSIDVFIEVIAHNLIARRKSSSGLMRHLVRFSTALQLLLTVISLTVSPPRRYPDLFPLLISTFAAGHFGYFFLYFNWAQWTLDNKLKSSSSS